MNGLDIVIVVASILLVVWTGLRASRSGDGSASGYFIASGRLPWYIIGPAFVATSVSSEQIVGTNGAAYDYGLAIANWEWIGLSYVPLVVFFLPVYLKNRVATIPDLLNRRFGPLCADLYSWAMLAAYVFIFLATTLYGGTTTFARLMGWNYHAVLWTMVLAVGFYTAKGGLLSVMWTDALQCVFLVGGGVSLFFAALGRIPGGWTAMELASPERFHLYRPPGDPIAPFLGLLMASVSVFLFYQAGSQLMVQRVLGARTTWDGIMGILFAGFINRIRPLVTCFLGLAVYHWTHEMRMAPALANRDQVFPFALQALAPDWGLRGIVVAGFAAAVMSTISALSNSTATIFALDVYRSRINPGGSDAQTVRVGRIASWVALVAAAAISPAVEHLGGIFLYFQKGVTFLAAPFMAVLILAIFWKRANYQGALFGMTAGTAFAMGLGFGSPLLGLDLHWLYLGFIAQTAIMIGIAVVSLATPAPDQARAEPFRWNLSLLRCYDSGAALPWYRNLALWFVVLYGIIAALYWRFW